MFKIFQTILFPSKLQLMGETKQAYVLARPRGPHILRNYCIVTPLPPVIPAPRKTLPRLCPLTLRYGVYLYLTARSCQHSRTIVSRLYRTSHATTRGASHLFVSETTSLTYGPQWPKCITTWWYRPSGATASTPNSHSRDTGFKPGDGISYSLGTFISSKRPF